VKKTKYTIQWNNTTLNMWETTHRSCYKIHQVQRTLEIQYIISRSYYRLQNDGLWSIGHHDTIQSLYNNNVKWMQKHKWHCNSIIDVLSYMITHVNYRFNELRIVIDMLGLGAILRHSANCFDKTDHSGSSLHTHSRFTNEDCYHRYHANWTRIE
jgi:hypothetical protein